MTFTRKPDEPHSGENRSTDSMETRSTTHMGAYSKDERTHTSSSLRNLCSKAEPSGRKALAISMEEAPRRTPPEIQQLTFKNSGR